MGVIFYGEQFKRKYKIRKYRIVQVFKGRMQ